MQTHDVGRSHAPTRRVRGRLRATALALAMLAIVGIATACDPSTPPPTAGVSTIDVSNPSGFGGGTIYYPTGMTGRRGVIAAVGGFTENQGAVSWYGPLLAKQGFIVITINTYSIFDNPTSRANQLLAALDYMKNSSPVKANVDPNRSAVMGHSMGGGGALEAAAMRPSIDAAIPLAPWDSGATFYDVTVPTMIVACQNDGIAPNNQHSLPFYGDIPNSVDKAYVGIAGAGHMCTNSSNPIIAERVIAWAKRFVNGDTSQNSVLCPALPEGNGVWLSMSTCPY